MKVKLTVSPDASIEVEQKDGVITSITFEPFFTGRRAPAVLAYGSSIADHGKVLETFQLTVSGGTGQVSKKSTSDRVTAAVDLTEPPVGSESGEDE